MKRSALRAQLAVDLERPRRRVAEFGRAWLDIKRPVIDPGTYARYADALERHVFPALGRLDLAEARAMDVQGWVNDELVRGYALTTVNGA